MKFAALRPLLLVLTLCAGLCATALPASAPTPPLMLAQTWIGEPGGVLDPAKELRERHTAAPIFERHPANYALFRAVNRHHHPALDFFFSRIILPLGKGVVLVPVLGLLLWRRRELAWPFLLAVAIEAILVTLLKPLLDQPRPSVLLVDIRLFEDVQRLSFPSGDTAQTFAVACVLAPAWGRRGWLTLLPIAVLVAYGRLYLGAHFPLDVLAGAAIGIGAALLARRLLVRRAPKKMKEES